MMQHAVERAGGRVAYMDTDSAFVVATESLGRGSHGSPA